MAWHEEVPGAKVIIYPQIRKIGLVFSGLKTYQTNHPLLWYFTEKCIVYTDM